MELVVRKNDLLKELSLLQGIVERKNTIPILANVLLEASKNQVALLATGLDVGLRTRSDATVGKPATLTLPAKTLFAVEGPLRQAYLNGVIPSEQRATVLSFDNMIGATGGVIRSVF